MKNTNYQLYGYYQEQRINSNLADTIKQSIKRFNEDLNNPKQKQKGASNGNA